MQKGDWVFVALLLVLIVGIISSKDPDPVLRGVLVLGIGILLILDQWFVGHTRWLYGLGGLVAVGGFFMVLAASASAEHGGRQRSPS